MVGYNTETECKFPSTGLCRATLFHRAAWGHPYGSVDTACAPEVNKGTRAVAVSFIALVHVCLMLLSFFALSLCSTWGTLEFYKANDHDFLESGRFFFSLNSPFLPARLSHFTTKVYASVNSPHHVGSGEGFIFNCLLLCWSEAAVFCGILLCLY